MSLMSDCEKEYAAAYNAEYAIQAMKKRKSDDNKKKDARKAALDAAYANVLVAYSAQISSGTVDSKDIWNCLAVIHKRYAADLGSLGIPANMQDQVIARVEAARQSWVRMSGLRFEDLVLQAVNANPRVINWNVKIMYPKDVRQLITAGKLNNDQDDINFIERAGDRFDLYVVQEIMSNLYVVGCIQNKTSIRDRVDRDTSFSQQAMEKHFWSAGVALDGEFFTNPLYQQMVNGKANSMHEINGWHGMYVLANVSDNDRIYKDDNTFKVLIDHMGQALSKRAANTVTFDHTWKAK